MKALFDINVVLDVTLDRQPFSAASGRVLGLAELGRVEGYLCASAIDTLDYLLSKTAGRTASREHLFTLRRILGITTVDAAAIDAALALGWSDIEDAIVHESARLAGCNAIVTRDEKGFAEATLPVFTPEEFLAAVNA